jgi:single-strand DNA-binding protein
MASLNKVFLIGNLTRDPEIRYLPSGQAVGDLRLAVTRRYKSAAGEDREETCFVSVVVWGKQAEACGKYLSKGQPAMVEGRLKYDEWEKDGQKMNRLNVVAERIQFLGAPRRAEYGAAGETPPPERERGGRTSEAAASPASAEEAPAGGADDDNLPF